jgi:hypothetical protein
MAAVSSEFLKLLKIIISLFFFLYKSPSMSMKAVHHLLNFTKFSNGKREYLKILNRQIFF